MRVVLISLLAVALSGTAQANQPTPGCNYRFWGGNSAIPNVEGFKVVTKAPEYHTTYTYGNVPAQKRYKQKPAYDGGPMVRTEKIIRPASNTIAQRTLLRPAYFMIKNEDDALVGRFDNAADVQNYVCSVLIPSYGQKKS